MPALVIWAFFQIPPAARTEQSAAQALIKRLAPGTADREVWIWTGANLVVCDRCIFS